MLFLHLLTAVEVNTEGGVLFASPDAKYLIAGTLYELSEDGSLC